MTCNDSDPVAIFWDYESCYPAPMASGYDVVNNIRDIGHKFGTVTLLKAYLKLSERTSSSLRSELQTSGVSLTDCPNSPVEKTMIVDMLAYAIDNPPSATIVLISVDRDFAYAVSVLRLRRYRVVLVVPSAEGIHISLKSQASVVLDCNQNVPSSSMLCNGFLRSRGLEDDGITSPRDKLGDRPESPIITYAPSFPMTTGGTIASHCRDVLAPQSSAVNTNVSSTNTRNPSECFPEPTTVGASKYHTPEGGRTQHGSFINEKSKSTATIRDDSSNMASKFGHGQLIGSDFPNFWPHFEPLPTDRTSFLRGGRTDLASAFPTVDRDGGNFLSSKNGSQAEVCSPQETDTRPLVARPSFSEDMGELGRTVLNSSSICSQFPRIISRGSTSTTEPEPVGMPLQSDETNSVPSAHATTESAVSFTKSSGVSERDAETQVAGLSLPAVAGTHSPTRTVNNGGDTRIVAVDVAPSTPGYPSSNPPPFQLLVDVLENLLLSGNFQPLRSVVGAQLIARNKLVYQQAGVVGFSQYISLAERAGFVNIGGTSGSAWVSLRLP